VQLQHSCIKTPKFKPICFVTGHDFSRAEKQRLKIRASAPALFASTTEFAQMSLVHLRQKGKKLIERRIPIFKIGILY
jgi:hypothetical protein